MPSSRSAGSRADFHVAARAVGFFFFFFRNCCCLRCPCKSLTIKRRKATAIGLAPDVTGWPVCRSCVSHCFNGYLAKISRELCIGSRRANKAEVQQRLKDKRRQRTWASGRNFADGMACSVRYRDLWGVRAAFSSDSIMRMSCLGGFRKFHWHWATSAWLCFHGARVRNL